jgi:DNA-binding PadR family transcriptional regulator
MTMHLTTKQRDALDRLPFPEPFTPISCGVSGHILWRLQRKGLVHSRTYGSRRQRLYWVTEAGRWERAKPIEEASE